MSEARSKKPVFNPAAAPLPRYRVVADQIAKLIREGALEPGQKMPPDNELVEMLQVSRPTVREAMISLEMMGYVETRFGYGAYVAQRLPTNHSGLLENCSFFELVEARYWFESDITAVAATTITDDDLAKLRGIFDKMADPGISISAVDTLDSDFHLQIARATQNNLFVSIMDQLWSARENFPKWARIRRQIVNAEANVHTVQEEHEKVLRALEIRDPAAAKAAMQLHCKNFGVPFLEEWRDEDTNGTFKDDIVLKIMNRMRPLD
jgi:DNA-binding FadR family transcriptional regulator